jgi:hypothetical protein
VRRGITLAVAQEAVVNLTLDVGDLKEQITVTLEAPIVNPTMSSTSGLVTGEQINHRLGPSGTRGEDHFGDRLWSTWIPRCLNGFL